MSTSACFRQSPQGQRRAVGVLAALLCIWLVGFATHLHAGEPDLHGSGAAHYCGVCASIPAGGAAPSVAVFVATPDRDGQIHVADDLRPVSSPTVSSYRSRAPPSP